MTNTTRRIVTEEIAGSIDIPDSAYEKAEARYKDLGEWFGRKEAHCHPFDPHIYPQGSFRLGTVIHPVDEEGEYDLDMGCRLRVGITKATYTQQQLKELVRLDLEEYRVARNIKAGLEEKHRCWRLHYADELTFHLDAVPSIPETTARRLLIQEAIIRTGAPPELAAIVAATTGAITDDRRWNYQIIENDWKISNSRILSVFILIFCLFYFNPYSQVLKVLHIHEVDYSAYSWYQQSISYVDLYYYPLAIMLILTLIHGYSKYAKYLVGFIFITALARMASIPVLYSWAFMVKEGFILPSVVLIISTALWLANTSFPPKVVAAMKSIWPLSMISYAIYIIHRPIFSIFVPFDAPSEFTFVLKLVLYLGVLGMVSYGLEINFQNWIKGFFFKKKNLPKAN